MMKTILFAAALSVSSLALAQTTTTEDSQPATQDTMAHEHSTTGATDMQTAPSGETMATQPTDPAAATAASPSTQPDSSAMAPTSGSEVGPGNTDPERDARGIPVVSAPATAPAGANQPVSVPAGATVVPSSNQAQVFTPMAGEAQYPACSRTVTDNCVQAYERGRKRR